MVVGVGFFIKYAIELNWINHLTRIILGVLVGIALIIFGKILSNKKYNLLGKIITSGGIATTYFITYASYYFVEYREIIGMSKEINFTLLILISFITILYAIRENSKIIACVSFFLGYLTFIINSPSGYLSLIYFLILTIGLAVLVSYKKWMWIGFSGIIVSYISYLFIYNLNLITEIIIVSVLFILYFIQTEVIGKNRLYGIISNFGLYIILVTGIISTPNVLTKTSILIT